MGTHLIDGEFQSDKYPTTPRGKVPLSVEDPTAQDLLWEYAQRRRTVDAEFSEDLELALLVAGYRGPVALRPSTDEVSSSPRTAWRRLSVECRSDKIVMELRLGDLRAVVEFWREDDCQVAQVSFDGEDGSQVRRQAHVAGLSLNTILDVNCFFEISVRGDDAWIFLRGVGAWRTMAAAFGEACVETMDAWSRQLLPMARGEEEATGARLSTEVGSRAMSTAEATGVLRAGTDAVDTVDPVLSRARHLLKHYWGDDPDGLEVESTIDPHLAGTWRDEFLSRQRALHLVNESLRRLLPQILRGLSRCLDARGPTCDDGRVGVDGVLPANAPQPGLGVLDLALYLERMEPIVDASSAGKAIGLMLPVASAVAEELRGLVWSGLDSALRVEQALVVGDTYQLGTAAVYACGIVGLLHRIARGRSEKWKAVEQAGRDGVVAILQEAAHLA